MMNESPAISIIVPVYNVEKYLRHCIDSILNQTFTNWELILINDGSEDLCGEICEEYAIKDGRIKVIHQKNGGVVNARNAGLRIATGKYLGFVDSDDHIESTMYEEMLSKAKSDNLQIVWCDWYETETIFGNTTTTTVHSRYVSDPNQALRNLLDDKIKGYLWNKLIEREYYNRCNIKTDASCTIMEDKYILVQLLCHQPLMGYVQKALYNYSSRTESATSSFNSSNPMIRGAVNVLNIYKFLQEYDLLSLYCKEFYRFAMKVKFTYVNYEEYISAQKFIPSAHQSISNYPIKGYFAPFHWLCFNCGKAGIWLWRLKSGIKKINS